MAGSCPNIPNHPGYVEHIAQLCLWTSVVYGMQLLQQVPCMYCWCT